MKNSKKKSTQKQSLRKEDIERDIAFELHHNIRNGLCSICMALSFNPKDKDPLAELAKLALKDVDRIADFLNWLVDKYSSEKKQKMFLEGDLYVNALVELKKNIKNSLIPISDALSLLGGGEDVSSDSLQKASIEVGNITNSINRFTKQHKRYNNRWDYEKELQI